MAPRMNLSPNFTLEELVFSPAALRKGIDNTPDAMQIDNLKALCLHVLEPVRALLGVPLHVDSGYRSAQVNLLVGSTAVHSAHLDGRAADIIPIGLDLISAFGIIKVSEIPFDQLIIECNAWLHISVAAAGELPRGECMTAAGRPGQWVYTHV
jgi:zinc D-Ala-D-Ala carboxypeptidase